MPDYTNANQTLSVGLNFLQAMGFSASSTSIETSRLLGDSLVMIYTSILAQRRIEVSYVAAHGNRTAAVSIFLCDISGERFSLEDWVTAKNSSSGLRFVADQNLQDEQSFLEQFCLKFRFVAEGPLYGTLMGVEWDAVPFDWKGYR